MADLRVTVNGVTFPNPVIVGSASPSMDWIGVKKGIEGGSGGVIVKSLFGEKGRLGRSFPRPRFKLYDYKNYPGYPCLLYTSVGRHPFERHPPRHLRDRPGHHLLPDGRGAEGGHPHLL